MENIIKMIDLKMRDEVIERKVWFGNTIVSVNHKKYIIDGWYHDTETGGDYDFYVGNKNIFDLFTEEEAEGIVELLREH